MVRRSATGKDEEETNNRVIAAIYQPLRIEEAPEISALWGMRNGNPALLSVNGGSS
jgi:hypothetical protein